MGGSCLSLPAIRRNGCRGGRLGGSRDRISAHRHDTCRANQTGVRRHPQFRLRRTVGVGLARHGATTTRRDWSSERFRWRILEICVAARSSAGEVGPKRCHRIRSFIASCRRIGRRFWLGRYYVATVGLGNHSLECGNEPNARSAWRALFRCYRRGTKQMESPAGF